MQKSSTNSNVKRPALGRGMAALLNPDLAIKGETNGQNNSGLGGAHLVDINKIKINKYQPRKIFKDKDLAELSLSIKENGLIQPLIVTEINGELELIAGERRLRAAKLAKLEKVPVIIRRASKRDSLVLAIIENVQRSDLNCVEEALAYYQLMDEFQLTQEEVAKQVGKDRSTIANFLRILKLPREVISYLQKEQLSFGHAKILAALTDAELIKRLAQQVVEGQLSVRELEDLTKKKRFEKKQENTNSYQERADEFKKTLEKRTGYHFDLSFKKNGSGQIKIRYNNEAEFNDIFEYLMK